MMEALKSHDYLTKLWARKLDGATSPVDSG